MRTTPRPISRCSLPLLPALLAAAAGGLGACTDTDGGVRKGLPGFGGDTAGAGASDGAGGDGGGADGGAGGDGGADGGDPPDPFNYGEVRGIWVTRWSYDEPNAVRAIFADVERGGFNTVFFQVRGNFDAYYSSSVEPWAKGLTGSLGGDPGWDPLAVAVEEARARGLKIHAYINVFPFWTGTTPPDSIGTPHALEAHPDWLVADTTGAPMALNSSYVFASPGNPEVRAHIAAVAADIAANYDVDGVHLDYIRYPGSAYSHDAASEAAFAADSSGLGWEDWQRRQVIATAQGVQDAVTPAVTAAVWGIYEDSFGWGGVSQGNVDYFQDSRAMVNEGAVDAIIPMIYWPVTETPGDRLDFRTLIEDHLAHRTSGKVFAGFGNTLTFDQAAACVRAAREAGADGVVLFDWSLFQADMDRFHDELFSD